MKKNILALMFITLSCSTLDATDTTSEGAAQAADAERKTELAADASGAQAGEKPYVFSSTNTARGTRLLIMFQQTPSGDPELPMKVAFKYLRNSQVSGTVFQFVGSAQESNKAKKTVIGQEEVLITIDRMEDIFNSHAGVELNDVQHKKQEDDLWHIYLSVLLRPGDFDKSDLKDWLKKVCYTTHTKE